MCGICGVFGRGRNGISVEKLAGMTDMITYRGPDDGALILFDAQNEFVRSKDGKDVPQDRDYLVGMGYRRLSILDLSASGNQPMFDSTDRYCIVFNGEIYNYVELRDELIAAGCHFKSHSDTEVILEAYRTWGVDCQRRFNGMWALAIWDRVEKVLFCSRDRFGVKPFYYAFKDGQFLFSSEVKQIHSYLEGPLKVSEHLLAEMLFWGMVAHTSETFITDIHCLPQSHCLLIKLDDLSSGNLTPRKYWEYQPGVRKSTDEAIEEFKELFIDSVRIRLRSDVPVSLSLSGGLDSSSVASVMHLLLSKQASPYVANMFTCYFDTPGYSELPFAESVVKKTNFNHYLLSPKPEDVQQYWADFVWHMEEPFTGLSYFSNFLLMKLVREKGIKVILNGQGGDELLLGYPRYRTAYYRILMRRRQYPTLFREIRSSLKNSDMSPVRQFLHQFYFTSTWLRGMRMSARVKPYLRPDFYHRHSQNLESIDDAANYTDLNDLQIKEYYKYQLQHLLRHEDRVSMASSVEVRSPFLDYRLLDFILGQSEELRIHTGWSKFILRSAMNGIIPDMVKNRTDKMGYSTPIIWLFGSNMEFFSSLLESSKDDPYINTAKVLADFRAGKVNDRILSGVLTYLQWRKTFRI